MIDMKKMLKEHTSDFLGIVFIFLFLLYAGISSAPGYFPENKNIQSVSMTTYMDSGEEIEKVTYVKPVNLSFSVRPDDLF